ncbi:MAG: hypothetical protein K2J12_05820 [Muribaculaceae bacterium]|nr:hypothetical protein [Muribaculaceae bacterium]
MKIYLQCGLRYLFGRLKILQEVKLIYIVLLRRLRIISHNKMKLIILDTLHPYPEILTMFRKKALKKVNPLVSALIERNKKAGHTIIFATAAPEFYVKAILPDDNVVASLYYPFDELFEYRGVRKVSELNAWLTCHNGILDTVITDHYDDAPLFDANKGGTNVLVNPSAKTLRFFRKLQPTHFLLIEEIDNLGVTR